ncbi:MAG: M48 family metallopeptidase [Candidatus Goldbacteria bacterium]|nr:M48 family metallopeptidase [Candidatus Goldiibacteriota bacterium]
MKFVPKHADGSVNAPKSSPVLEFLYLSIGLLAVIGAVYFILGAAVDLIVPHISAETERKISSAFAVKYAPSAKRPAEELRLQKLTDDLGKLTGFPAGAFTVRFINDKTENAAALPGGIIFFYKGLYDKLNDENEIVFVLAHEMGHFNNRDHLRRLGRSLIFILLMAGFNSSSNDISGLVNMGLGSAETGFSRHQEIKADLFAADLLMKKYGSAAGAKKVLSLFKTRENGSEFMYFLSTHPHSGKRIEAIEKHLKQAGER